jgi:TPR repeat protein
MTLSLYEEAATDSYRYEGNADAQFELGKIYENGYYGHSINEFEMCVL